jgi:hypothetical protein
MFEAVKGWLLRLLRVPAQPRAPKGGRIVRIFRAAPAYFRYRLALWGLHQLGALLGLLGSLVFVTYLGESGHPVADFLLRAAETMAWITFLAQLPFSFAVLRLDFEMRWYIRFVVLRKREQRLGRVADEDGILERHPAAPHYQIQGNVDRHPCRRRTRRGQRGSLRVSASLRETPSDVEARAYSTVTLLARLRGWSTLLPRSTAMW